MGEKPYKCDLCPAEFIESTKLRYHKRKHTGEEPYKCDLCPAEFTGSTKLRCHKQTHISEEQKKAAVGFTSRTSSEAPAITHLQVSPLQVHSSRSTGLGGSVGSVFAF
ncbi:zinc finger protein 239-like [Ornithodoros turicata]|uniref:zinc finger protein 239-like n=1 Tax=Ornithodoros turicata TaxID=34597 RepID=UPI003139D10D